MIRRLVDLYLGGDPNCTCHRALQAARLGLFPLPGERRRVQRLIHRPRWYRCPAKDWRAS